MDVGRAAAARSANDRRKHATRLSDTLTLSPRAGRGEAGPGSSRALRSGCCAPKTKTFARAKRSQSAPAAAGSIAAVAIVRDAVVVRDPKAGFRLDHARSGERNRRLIAWIARAPLSIIAGEHGRG